MRHLHTTLLFVGIAPLCAAQGSLIPLGNAVNAWSIRMCEQNQVCYEPALNTVAFAHRADPAEYGDQGGTGTLRFDVSTDGGATWTLDHLLTPTLFDGTADTITGCRYPNIAIYNPPGNTDTANAYAVSTGMALTDMDPNEVYGFMQRSSARLDGAAATCAFQDTYGDHTTFSSYGLVSKGDGTLWDMSTRYSNAENNADSLHYTDFRINKGVWNATEQRMDWTDVATLTPQFFIMALPDPEPCMHDWNFGFSPDGQTGYAVIIGKENDGLPTGYIPLIWKSADGGETWNKLPNHDFSLEPWVLENIVPTEDTELPSPYFKLTDITVDANGRLHMISGIASRVLGSNTPDGIGILYEELDSQFIIHTSTVDGTTWTMSTLSPKLADDYPWPNSDGTEGPEQDDRPQASRTADGSHVFFTWNQTTDASTNVFPDIHGIGYDVSTDLWTTERSLSAGTDAEYNSWWQAMSPTAITGGDDHMYELPIVIARPGDYSDLPSGFSYLKGIGFDENEFVVGMKEMDTAGSISVFPNPGDGLFTVSLVNTGAADLRVTDTQGRLVRMFRTSSVQAQLDLRDQPAGMYLLCVTDSKGSYPRRLLVR